VFKLIPPRRGRQRPRRPFPAPWRVASAVYLVLGLACLGDFHTALVMGIGYLILAYSYFRGHQSTPS
jgi:hypothetical protein